MSQTIRCYKPNRGEISKTDRLVLGIDENKHEPITRGQVEEVITVKDGSLVIANVKTEDVRVKEKLIHPPLEATIREKKTKAQILRLKKAKLESTFKNKRIV